MIKKKHGKNLVVTDQNLFKVDAATIVLLSLGTYDGSKRNSVETMLMQIFEGQTKGSMVFFILANSRIPDF